MRRAATAEPGTPEAHVASFTDPGSTGLANAQARYETARASLQHTGDESAATIHTATDTPNGDINITDGLTSDDWERVGLPFFKGLGEAAAELAIGVWEIFPFQKMIEHGWGPGWDEYVSMWAELGNAIGHDPLGVGLQLLKDFIAYDYWEDNPAEAVGRVFFNTLTLGVSELAALKAMSKLGKLAKGATGGNAGAAAAVARMRLLLKNSAGVSVNGDRVLVNGVDKMSLTELTKLYDESVHNMGASQATLGKFIKGDPDSYEQVAEAAGDAHFNLKDPGWDDAKTQYGLTDAELYELLNKPFLEEIVEKNLPVQFTVDPRGDTHTLGREYDFLTRSNYTFDTSTLTMSPTN